MIEPILLYGSETRTLNARQQQRLDGTYTRLLMRVRNISWRSHPTLQTIYGDLPRVSQVVRSRRVQFAGHCFRATNEVVSPLILWKSQSVGHRSRKLTYPDVIARDSGIRFEDLSVAMAMQDRNTWRDIERVVIDCGQKTDHEVSAGVRSHCQVLLPQLKIVLSINFFYNLSVLFCFLQFLY